MIVAPRSAKLPGPWPTTPGGDRRSEPSSHGGPQSYFDGKRVSGLYQRTTGSGRVVFEFNGRLDGKMRRVKLRSTLRTDAVNEVRALRVDVERGDVSLGDRNPHDRAARSELPRP